MFRESGGGVWDWACVSVFHRSTKRVCFKRRNVNSDCVNITRSSLTSCFYQHMCKEGEKKDNGGRRLSCFAFLLYQNEPGSHVCPAQLLWHTQITMMHSAFFTPRLKSCLEINLSLKENFSSVIFAFTVYGYVKVNFIVIQTIQQGAHSGTKGRLSELKCREIQK